MSKTTSKAHVTLDLDDVRHAGGVEQAIIAWSKESDTTSAGVVGPSFSTSGPGPGWSKNHDATDYAARAVKGGAMYYLDETDGTLATAVETNDEDGIRCEGGVYEIEWSDASVVCLVCPDIEDAIEEPKFVAEMAQAVIDYHGPMSDRKAWAELVREIKAAADALEDIDADDICDAE